MGLAAKESFDHAETRDINTLKDRGKRNKTSSKAVVWNQFKFYELSGHIHIEPKSLQVQPILHLTPNNLDELARIRHKFGDALCFTRLSINQPRFKQTTSQIFYEQFPNEFVNTKHEWDR